MPEGIKENEKDEEKVVTQAERQRELLLAFGNGFLSPLAANQQGRWSFPSGEPSAWSILGGLRNSKVEGYIVFAEDGRSGDVAEVKSGRPETYYKISKLA